MRLWYARLAGVAASQMLLVALGWEMYALTGSTFDLGLVGLAQFVPALLLALPAGHAIDRLHRARIVAACFATMLAASLALWLAAWTGTTSRGLLLGLAVVLGGVRAFQMPAQQAIVPALVPMAMLPRALAFSSSGMQGAIVAGPAIGGFVFVAGAAALYATCAALFALATAVRFHPRATGRARRYLARPVRRAARGRHGAAAGLREGRARHRRLGAGAAACRARGGRARDGARVGALAAAAPHGAVAARRGGPLRRDDALGFAVSTSMALSLAALAVGGAADMVSIVIRQTLVQLETPDAMRGRVSAVNSVFIGASNQLGEFRAGAMASVIGPFGAVVAGGLGTIAVAALWVRLFPALARRDRLVPAA